MATAEQKHRNIKSRNKLKLETEKRHTEKIEKTSVPAEEERVLILILPLNENCVSFTKKSDNRKQRFEKDRREKKTHLCKTKNRTNKILLKHPRFQKF